MYITEPLHRLIIAAQLAAAVNALFAALPLVLFIASAPGEQLTRGAVAIIIFGAFCLVTSIALFTLAWFMGQGWVWAYFVTWFISALLAVQVVADLGGILSLGAERYFVRRIVCCGVSHLPHLLLAVAAINSVDEIRTVLRQRRRGRLPQVGAVTGAIPSIPPPPPARDHPCRR